MTIEDIFERVSDFESKAASLQLRRYEWDFLHALDGCKSVREIGKSLGLDEAHLERLVAYFEAGELIEARTLTLAEYRKVLTFASTPSKNQNGQSPALSAGSTTGTAARSISFSLKRSVPAASRSNKPMQLKPILDFVTQHAGGGTAGQIAAYRVLLKIPKTLLQTMKIESLSFVDENYLLPSEEAYKAVLEGVTSVLGVSYPS